MAESVNKTISNRYSKFYLDSIAGDFYTRGKKIANKASDIGESYSKTTGTAGDEAYQGSKSSLPVDITRQVDSASYLYTETFNTKPRMLTMKDKMLKPYDIKTAVREEEVAKIREKVSNYMAYNFAPTKAARIITATGTDRTTALAGNGIATGNRKGIAEYNIIDAMALQAKFKNNFGGETIALINDAFIKDLLKIEMFVKYDATGIAGMRAKAFEQGFIQIGGITWMFRSNFKNCTGIRYATDGATKKSDNVDTLVSTDKAAVLFFNTNAVLWAVDPLYVTTNDNEPTYEQADITQIATFAIGGIERVDEEGVCAIVEG